MTILGHGVTEAIGSVTKWLKSAIEGIPTKPDYKARGRFTQLGQVVIGRRQRDRSGGLDLGCSAVDRAAQVV